MSHNTLDFDKIEIYSIVEIFNAECVNYEFPTPGCTYRYNLTKRDNFSMVTIFIHTFVSVDFSKTNNLIVRGGHSTYVSIVFLIWKKYINMFPIRYKKLLITFGSWVRLGNAKVTAQRTRG